MNIVYNTYTPTKTYIDQSTCTDTYTSRNYRLASLDKVYDREPGLREILDRAPIWGHHTRTLIDVKVQELTKGQYTCTNKAWHLDGTSVLKQRRPSDSIYHIITWGGAPTLFIKHPFGVDAIGSDQRLIQSTLNLNVHVRYELEPYTYHSYGEFHWHKCGQATEDCTRFFIRIVETDYIKEHKI